jgi:WD40 repeat protein
MIALSPDGKTLASGQSGNHMIRLWDVATGAQLPALEGHLSSVTGLGFSPDGSLLVSGAGVDGLRAASPDTSVRLWDAVTGEQLRVLEGPTQTLITNLFSPDGTRMMSASQDGTIRIWGLPREGDDG